MKSTRLAIAAILLAGLVFTAFATKYVTFDPIGSEKHGWMLSQLELVQIADTLDCNILVFRNLGDAMSPPDQWDHLRMGKALSRRGDTRNITMRIIQPSVFYIGQPRLQILSSKHEDSRCLGELVNLALRKKYTVQVVQD